MGARAILAIVSICALVFGLLITGAPHAFASGKRVGAHGVAAFCHDLQIGAARVDGATPDKGGEKPGAYCPCCLAAHAGPAVLPERFAFVLRAEPVATPAVYRSTPQELPHFTLRQAVNCARAPPASATLV
jgi:hypothetical protein